MCFVVCRHCRHKFVQNVISSIVFMLTLLIHAFSAVHTVAAGHRMVTEGWTLFERTCEEVGPECDDPYSGFSWTFHSCEAGANGGRIQVFIHTSVGTATLPQGQNVQQMHTSIVFTQRRPSCAPSVISAHTTWIHSRDMRRSTSRVFLVLGVMS